MVLRIDPTVPLVWRTPDCIQLGVDAPLAVIDQVTEPIERMVAALVAGISRSGLDMIARSTRAAAGEADRLLALLDPVLSSPVRARAGSVLVEGSGPTASLLRQLLGEPGDDPDLVVLVAHHVTRPERAAQLLRRDVPHLAIVYGDSEVRIGPVVEPGSGPCLRCLELHRRDADPAWPAIATQLLGRSSQLERPLLATEVAAAAARVALGRLASGPGSAVGITIAGADGSRVERRWQPHPECGCIRLPEALGEGEALSAPEALSAGRPESGRAIARLPGRSPSPPSSTPAGAALG